MVTPAQGRLWAGNPRQRAQLLPERPVTHSPRFKSGSSAGTLDAILRNFDFVVSFDRRALARSTAVLTYKVADPG